MSDETKLEGDDRITWEMHNVWCAWLGARPVTMLDWRDNYSHERNRAMKCLLSWVRAHLVAPAEAEAVKERDSLSAEAEERKQAALKWAAEADSLRAKVAALEEERISVGTNKMLWEGRALALEKKCERLEAQVEAARRDEPQLPKVGETVEVLPRLVGKGAVWPAKVAEHWPRGNGFNAVDEDGNQYPFNVVNEGKTWRRVQPQPAPSVQDIIDSMPRLDPKTPREHLLVAVQRYAEEWASGKSTIQSPAKTSLYIAIDAVESAGIAAATEKLRAENDDLRRQLDTVRHEKNVLVVAQSELERKLKERA